MTDAPKSITLRDLGLRSLKQIPEHIPTVTWSWVSSGNCGKLDFEFMHAAFAARIDADSSKAPSTSITALPTGLTGNNAAGDPVKNGKQGKQIVVGNSGLPSAFNNLDSGDFSRIEYVTRISND